MDGGHPPPAGANAPADRTLTDANLREGRVCDQGGAGSDAPRRGRARADPGHRRAAGDPAALPGARPAGAEARRVARLEARCLRWLPPDATARGDQRRGRVARRRGFPGAARGASSSRWAERRRDIRARRALGGDRPSGLGGRRPRDLRRPRDSRAGAPERRARDVSHMTPRPKIASSVLELIGHTPMVRLNRLPKPGGASVVAKLESVNPGGSVKDRIAAAMLEAAEQQGRLQPGSTIVEPTSGNTGIGLAMAAAVKGYRLILTMPDDMSVER